MQSQYRRRLQAAAAAEATESRHSISEYGRLGIERRGLVASPLVKQRFLASR
ncbi:hypothetical protein MLP_30550 [Microlunatus phosphovorus NM-1]|uniref:Uncharacterized protein n=1 Tax=Microlunatus phosphovorus (strain ATCC 700054 / DSM 10555 / JCM 9379 / NBRC 101784 / NCIMB 13414 / VKM Ac-1990 / NM-1) TaxID=1032480 RepID=F5XKJ7_MICPN|nr:hypothetical protein MLP_30550 [Microlunatus phosphovorus NM-1]